MENLPCYRFDSKPAESIRFAPISPKLDFPSSEIANMAERRAKWG